MFLDFSNANKDLNMLHSAVQINGVKGFVSTAVAYTTVDHVFLWRAEYKQVSENTPTLLLKLDIPYAVPYPS